MAAVSFSTVTTSLSINPKSAIRSTSLSPFSSVFFSYNITNRAGFGLSVDPFKRAKKRGLSCNSLFGLGVPELVVIAGVTALVFGPKKLPEVGRSIGKTVKSFQQAAKEFETELKKDAEPAAEASSEKIKTASEE
ncbi:hypothetical protein OROGR_020354 [Orobanche gracilis]